MNQPPIRVALFGAVNTYLVPEKDGLTLIDSAMPQLVPQILRRAAQLGQPIRRVLLTHGHPDHVGGLDAIKRVFPQARVGLGAADLHYLERGEGKTRPDFFLVGGEQIGSLHLIPAPGHSAGQFAFWDERDGTLYAGDSFTTIGTVRSASEFKLGFHALAWISNEDAALATQSAATLSQLPGVTWLAAGHGAPLARPQAQMRAAVSRAQQPASIPEWQLNLVEPLRRRAAAERA